MIDNMTMLAQALDDVSRGRHVVFDQEKFHVRFSDGSLPLAHRLLAYRVVPQRGARSRPPDDQPVQTRQSGFIMPPRFVGTTLGFIDQALFLPIPIQAQTRNYLSRRVTLLVGMGTFLVVFQNLARLRIHSDFVHGTAALDVEGVAQTTLLALQFFVGYRSSPSFQSDGAGIGDADFRSLLKFLTSVCQRNSGWHRHQTDKDHTACYRGKSNHHILLGNMIYEWPDMVVLAAAHG